MTDDEFWKMDATLNEIHTVISQLMGSGVGYKLTKKDIEGLERAEEDLELRVRRPLAMDRRG
jgi:hypothetical protein